MNTNTLHSRLHIPPLKNVAASLKYHHMKTHIMTSPYIFKLHITHPQIHKDVHTDIHAVSMSNIHLQE